MSQFKVGDVVQRVKLPHYVGVVVKLPEMWGDDKKQSYIVATITSITKKCNETFFAEDLKPYAYGVPNDNLYLEYTTGDLVTFSVKSSSGYCSEETFYVGPRENCRCVNGLWYYPFINWEDGETYYGSRYWGDVKKVVKPKLKIGDFVRLAGKVSSPVVKITYDRPYKTHVYTLENELFISETRLAEFVFDEKDKSWSHKDVKPVAKTIEKPESADDLKVGDVVQDRRVDNGDGIGVVLKAEYPRYTVNWVVIDNATADWAEKLVYRDNLKSYFHKSVRNTSDGRKVNCVLGVNTAKGKEFYQIAASEVKVIDGTWYYPYVNLQTSELRYGRYYWKDPDERLYPEFKLGDKLVLTSALDIKLITAVSFDIPTKKFSYCVNEGWGYILEEHLSTFKKQGDTWYHPSVLEQKEKIVVDTETVDLTSDPFTNEVIDYAFGPATKETIVVTNPELAKKISGCKDSTGSVFVFGKEEFVGEPFNQTAHKIESFSNIYDQIKKDFVENPSKYGPPIVVDPKAYKEQVKTLDSIEEKGSVLSSNPTLTVTVNGKERVFEPAFKDLWRDTETTDLTSDPFTGLSNQFIESCLEKDLWVPAHKIGPGIGDPKTIAKLELSAPSTNEYSDTFFNKHDQIEKAITSELLGKDTWDLTEKDLKTCFEECSIKRADRKKWAEEFGKSVANHYDNAMRLQQFMQSKNAQVKVILAENSVKDTEPKGVKMNLSPVNARVIRLRSVRLLDSLSKKFFLERFPDDVANFKIVGNLIDSKVPAALVLSLAGFSCKYGLPKAPTDIKPIVETLQKEFTEESQAMLTNAQLGVLKLIGDEVIASLISLVKEHVTDNDI